MAGSSCDWQTFLKRGTSSLLKVHSIRITPMKIVHFIFLVCTSALAQTGADRATTRIGTNHVFITISGGERVITAIGLRYPAHGFPIYTSRGYTIANDPRSPLKIMRSSYQLKKGERSGGPGGKYDGKFTVDYEYVKGSGDLDECNGRFGVSPEHPEGIYHY